MGCDWYNVTFNKLNGFRCIFMGKSYTQLFEILKSINIDLNRICIINCNYSEIYQRKNQNREDQDFLKYEFFYGYNYPELQMNMELCGPYEIQDDQGVYNLVSELDNSDQEKYNDIQSKIDILSNYTISGVFTIREVGLINLLSSSQISITDILEYEEEWINDQEM